MDFGRHSTPCPSKPNERMASGVGPWRQSTVPIPGSAGLNQMEGDVMWGATLCQRPGPVFCLLLRVSWGYAQPITGHVTEVTCPEIGQAQSELTPSMGQKTGPGVKHRNTWGPRLHNCQKGDRHLHSTCMSHWCSWSKRISRGSRYGLEESEHVLQLLSGKWHIWCLLSWGPSHSSGDSDHKHEGILTMASMHISICTDCRGPSCKSNIW